MLSHSPLTHLEGSADPQGSRPRVEIKFLESLLCVVTSLSKKRTAPLELPVSAQMLAFLSQTLMEKSKAVTHRAEPGPREVVTRVLAGQ